MVTRIVVGAGYGFGDWLLQRVTAVVMALYTVIMGLTLLCGPTLTQESWRALMSGNFMRVISLLFIVSLAYHAWVGVRDIWMDYMNSTALRLFLHVVTLLALVGYAGWAVQIIWRL